MVAKVIPDERICLGCGNTFLVGGTGRKKRGTKACSQACNGLVKSTVPGTPANHLTVANAAYLAGMIDADGHIGLYSRGPSQSLRVHADVSNTDRELLLWIREVTGVGSVNKQKDETATHKASFAWNTSSESAITLLRQVIPYMRVKRARAKLAIDFYTKRQEIGNRIDLSWQEPYRAKMLELNRRGPRGTR
jgi:hypothetical protein